MLRSLLRHPVLFILLGGILILGAACSKRPAPTEVQMSGVIRGKVTYDGKAVPYGYVLFYSLDHSFDPNAKGFAATGFAPIMEDGSYEAGGVPLGALKVCVLTDPDVDAVRALGAKPLLGDKGMPGGSPGGPRGGPPSDPPGGQAKGPEGPAANPIDGHRPGSRPNPRVEKLKPEQIQMLKDIDARYGTFAVSPLTYAAHPGEQTFDLELKGKDRKEEKKSSPK